MSDSFISEEEKIHCLEKVLKSRIFKGESTYRKVLKYYRNNLMDKIDVDFSETSIALDALGKDLQFNPYYDSSVRVAMHRLRNNLLNYYSSDGKEDPVKIHIPIGDYNPFFYKDKNTSDSANYCIQLMQAVLFQIEYTLSEHSVELYNYVIQSNAECLLKNANHFYSCSIPFNLLHYPLILNRILPVDRKELEEMVDDIYRNNPGDYYALILKSYHCLFLEEREDACRYAREAYDQSENIRLRGVSLVLQFFSGIFDGKTIETFVEIQNEHTQHPPYWLIANIIIAIKSGKWTEAYRMAKRFNAIPSKLSRTLYLAVKRKTRELTEEETRYIRENSADFSPGYLSHFLYPVVDRLL